jgi:hypothetical protein
MIRRIEIFALPLKSTYVLLSPEYRKFLYNTVIDNGGVKKISKMINLDKNYFLRFKNGHKCSLDFIFSLYNRLGMDLKELNRNVIQIVSGSNNSIGINYPKLPFGFDNKYGGTLLAAIMGDGSRSKLGSVIYNNQNQILIDFLIESCTNIFGDFHYRTYPKKDGTIQVFLPKIVGDIVGLFGIKKSYKTVSDCYVELENFSKKFKIAFIRQFFDDEGNVRKSDRRLQIKQTRIVNVDKTTIRSEIEKYAPRMLIEIKKTLQEFNIISRISLETLRNVNGIKKADFSLNIYRKENLEKFKNLIGFKLKYKNESLKEVIKSYKYPSAGRNERLLYALQYAAKIELRYGYIDKLKLVEETKRALWRTCTYYLVDLKKSGFIDVIEKPRNERGNPLPWKYKLTKGGWKFLKSNISKIFLRKVKKYNFDG